MALDTSADGYERAYGYGPENAGKYTEGYVEKKGTFMTRWIRYWCVLKDQNIHFFTDVNTQIKANYFGFCHLDGGTNFGTGKTKDGKYEWFIQKGKDKLVLRTSEESLRDTWITSIKKSIKHEQPNTESHILPGSGPVSPKKENFNNNPSSPLGRKFSGKYNMMEPNQLASLQKLGETMETLGECSNQELQFDDDLLSSSKEWFRPSCRREEVESILRTQRDGTFVVRNYIDTATNTEKGYVLSLKDETSQVRHHRIERRSGVLFLKGYEGRSFQDIKSLVNFFILSQRSKVELLPYDPPKTNAQAPQKPASYENMDNQSPQKPVPSGYERMEGRQQDNGRVPSGRAPSFQGRRLPDPPTSGAKSPGTSEPTRGPDYMQMTTPSRNGGLPSTPQSNDAAVRRPLPPTPLEDSSYVNVPPPIQSGPYENLQNTPFQEAPPILPPKRRAASVRETPSYVNYPEGNSQARRHLERSQTLR